MHPTFDQVGESLTKADPPDWPALINRAQRKRAAAVGMTAANGSRHRDVVLFRRQIGRGKMAERPVLVGLIPQAVVLDTGDQVSWMSDAGNLRVEFDVNRCPFGSNIFQAPGGMRLLSGPPRVGTKGGTYKYRVWLNDQMVGQGEVILREK